MRGTRVRKKPIEVEAIELRPGTINRIVEWGEGAIRLARHEVAMNRKNPEGLCIEIKTLEGTMVGTYGDWIIKGVRGEFYPCDGEVFFNTYEIIE